MTVRTLLVATLLLASSSALAQSSVRDPAMTPGAVNADVRQDNIGTTICVPGWTRTVRPDRHYTSALKRQQLAAQGYVHAASAFEEDHLIPLSLAGRRPIRATSGPSQENRRTGGEPIRKTSWKQLCRVWSATASYRSVKRSKQSPMTGARRIATISEARRSEPSRAVAPRTLGPPQPAPRAARQPGRLRPHGAELQVLEKEAASNDVNQGERP